MSNGGCVVTNEWCRFWEFGLEKCGGFTKKNIERRTWMWENTSKSNVPFWVKMSRFIGENVKKTSLPHFRVKLSCVCLPYVCFIEKKVMTYSDPMVTYSYPKITYPKVT